MAAKNRGPRWIIVACISFGGICLYLFYQSNSVRPTQRPLISESPPNESSLELNVNQTTINLCIPEDGNPSYATDSFNWCSRESSLRGPHQKVITYVIYGTATNSSIYQRYYKSINDVLQKTVDEYPGWFVRIYHNLSIKQPDDQLGYFLLHDARCRFQHVDLCDVTEIAHRIGGEKTPIDPQQLRGLNRRMLRFLVMLDPDVDVFISRDIDSHILRREVDAVTQWLESNFTFHAMIDHKYHGAVMLAGMWGAKIYRRRDLIEGLARAMIEVGQDQSIRSDQECLRMILWPSAKFDVMAHDSFLCSSPVILRASPLKIFPFPTQRNGTNFVGAVGNSTLKRNDKCPLACRPPAHKDWQYC